MKKVCITASLFVMVLNGSGCTVATHDAVVRRSIQPTEEVRLAVGTATTTDAGWRNILAPDAYNVIWQKGTEAPFSSPLDKETRPGTYVSADCGVPLFRSEQKYDSGTGWPSFWKPIHESAMRLAVDNSIPFEPRTEVLDAACGGHLGHVFDDGPAPTGKRYCMNGVALRFIPDTTTTDKGQER